jgi:hypothetical protein
MEIDSYEIKLTGGANLEACEGQEIKISHEYTIGMTVNCYDESLKDNQNGTYRKVFKFKPSGGVLISKDWGKRTIKATGKGSPSQKLRNALFYKHGEQGIDEDFESWYEKEMSKIISNL